MLDFKLFPQIDLSSPTLIANGITTEQQQMDTLVVGIRHLARCEVTGYVEDHFMHLQTAPANRVQVKQALDFLHWDYEIADVPEPVLLDKGTGDQRMDEAFVLTLRRGTAKCGCTLAGPAESCEQGSRLFAAVRQAYSRAVGALPSDDAAWSPYETGRAAYYRHLGERITLAGLLPELPTGAEELRVALTQLLCNMVATTQEDYDAQAEGILCWLRPDLALVRSH